MLKMLTLGKNRAAPASGGGYSYTVVQNLKTSFGGIVLLMDR